MTMGVIAVRTYTMVNVNSKTLSNNIKELMHQGAMDFILAYYAGTNRIRLDISMLREYLDMAMENLKQQNQIAAYDVRWTTSDKNLVVTVEFKQFNCINWTRIDANIGFDSDIHVTD